MTTKIKSLAKGICCFLAFLHIAAFVVLWVISGQILSPERQPIQDYQLEWLNKASTHGMRIYQAKCDKGHVPCLFVDPDRSSEPGERGKILRQQLEDHSVSLKDFGETQGILMLLHGRNSRKEALLPVAERFTAIGFRCVIPDLPAHGDSSVKEMSFATTAFEQDITKNVLADARRFFGDVTSPAMVWGLSMGGAYAIESASRSPYTWKAVVIVSSFDSLQGVIEDRIDALPRIFKSLICKVLFKIIEIRSGFEVPLVEPVRWAKKVTAPTLMAHGDADSLITWKRGKRLFNAIGSKKKLWVNVTDANHNNILITPMPLYAAMGEWLINNSR